jgi:hypothetical protein
MIPAGTSVTTFPTHCAVFDAPYHIQYHTSLKLGICQFLNKFVEALFVLVFLAVVCWTAGFILLSPNS